MESTLLNIFLLCLSTTVLGSADKIGCGYPKHLSEEAKNRESQIADLIGDRYVVSDGEFTYYIGVCTEAMDPYPEGAGDLTGAGVVQMHNQRWYESCHTIGRYGKADIKAGDKWVMLEYNDGERYKDRYDPDHTCIGADLMREKMGARILFTCNENDVEPVASFFGGPNKTDGCYYLFEVSTSTVCRRRTVIRNPFPWITMENLWRFLKGIFGLFANLFSRA